jgi:hypothetical protein
VTALIPSIIDSPPVSFLSAVGVATLTESLFRAKTLTLLLRKVAKANHCASGILCLGQEPSAIRDVPLYPSARSSNLTPNCRAALPPIISASMSSGTPARSVVFDGVELAVAGGIEKAPKGPVVAATLTGKASKTN